MSGGRFIVNVRDHVMDVERLEPNRWRVSIDGRRLATYCTESRARAAGRLEARRLDFVEGETRERARRSAGPPGPGTGETGP